jgi:hypothetical protein
LGRPSVLTDRAMTPAERQRRHSAKIVNIEQVARHLGPQLRPPVLIEKKAIRAGVKKLLARWQREAEASRRYWAKRFPK